MAPGSDERQIGIMPNGHSTYTEKNNAKYLRTIRKYSSIIQGQFFGHLHSDSFRIVYNDMGKTFLLHFNSSFSFLSSRFSLLMLKNISYIEIEFTSCLIPSYFERRNKEGELNEVKRLKDIFFICQLFNP
jgi:hypothetical protein